MLDPIRGVRGAAAVVVGERDALDVIEDAGSEAEDELLVDEGPEHGDGQRLELGEEHNGQQEADNEDQQELGRTRDAVGNERRDDAR